MRRALSFTLAFALFSAALPAQDMRLPVKKDSLFFAVIGDSGTGDSNQRRVAEALYKERTRVPFNMVLMMGDNLYGGDRPKDYDKKFAIPYKPLLDAGVKFYASLGNHDNPNQAMYKPFNMNGERYYSFKPEKSSARFFAIDSNYIDDKQIAWLEKELAASGSDWKIMFFHHPLYSSGGTHGSADAQREKLEPIFLKHGVNVVLSGHEHFYERVKPQKGIAYFTIGSSAKLRRGDLKRSSLTEKGWDEGYGFVLMEINGNDLYFEALSDTGQVIDSGVVHRTGKTEPQPGRSTQPVVTTRPAPPARGAAPQP
jgi:3',5'-cyclic AMP phosphodiesterase CpdA